MLLRKCALLLVCLPLLFACENVGPDAVNLQLDFSWGRHPGENRQNPEIRVTGIPDGTRSLEVQLNDLDVPFPGHGDAEIVPYEGTGVVARGCLKQYLGPSPPRREGHAGNRYEFTVRALDENGRVLGIGKRMKRCCPETAS